MNGKDLFLGLNYVNARFIDEAETVTDLKETHRYVSLRKVLWIAAVIALLALTITACAYAIQKIRMNLVQHSVPVQTETMDASQPAPAQEVNLLTDCYPQVTPAGYEILWGSPTNHTSRGIVYQNEKENSIHFQISSVPRENDIVLRPPVEESVVNLTWGEAVLMKNEGAQVLIWHNEEEGYHASLFTDDLHVDLCAMANSMGYGQPIPLSVWYHRGREWNPWYPQSLPEGYNCTDVAPVGNGFQSFTYTNGSHSIRYGISTEGELVPGSISDEVQWEEATVNGTAAKLLRRPDGQRTLYWENKAEGFWAFLEATDETADLEALAEHVGPGEKMEVSKAHLGPDYTIELEQEPTTYVQWQSVYPQDIAAGYQLETVGDKAYGQQTMEWSNADGDWITYTLYFRLGQYGREFDGSGQPETVSINGNTGYLTGKRLLWADEQLGFAYELQASGDVDLIALAQSVAPGPELEITNDSTAKALEQLGDYQITELPHNMVEDGLAGAPLEGDEDWYSYVRRWYFDKTNNHQVYFTYETYLTDCAAEEEVLRLFVSGTAEPDFVTINGYPGITLQNGSKAYVAWMDGDVRQGISFQLYSEHYPVEALLEMAYSVKIP